MARRINLSKSQLERRVSKQDRGFKGCMCQGTLKLFWQFMVAQLPIKFFLYFGSYLYTIQHVITHRKPVAVTLTHPHSNNPASGDSSSITFHTAGTGKHYSCTRTMELRNETCTQQCGCVNRLCTYTPNTYTYAYSAYKIVNHIKLP